MVYIDNQLWIDGCFLGDIQDWQWSSGLLQMEMMMTMTMLHKKNIDAYAWNVICI